FCPKCGKPLRRSECLRGKQFGIVPRLLCPECKSYVERSGALAFASGVALLLGAILGPLTSEGWPDMVIASTCISAPIRLCLFLVGILALDRQARKAKHYVSAHNQTLSER